MPELDARMTQTEFGLLVGISQPTVSELLSRQILVDGGTAGEWLLSYCEHLREMAAGRGGEGSIELAKERALLAREQRAKLEMQNAVTRGELAPAHLLEQVLARAGARASRVLETIPGEVRRRAPQLTSDDIGAITRIVAKARNIAAAMTLADLAAADESSGSEDDLDQAAEAA